MFRKRLCGNRPEVRSKHDLCTHLPSFLCLCDAYVSIVAGDGQSAYAAEDLSRWSTEEGQQLAWDIMTGLGLRDGTQVHPYGPDA